MIQPQELDLEPSSTSNKWCLRIIQKMWTILKTNEEVEAAVEIQKEFRQHCLASPHKDPIE